MFEGMNFPFLMSVCFISTPGRVHRSLQCTAQVLMARILAKLLQLTLLVQDLSEIIVHSCPWAFFLLFETKKNFYTLYSIFNCLSFFLNSFVLPPMLIRQICNKSDYLWINSSPSADGEWFVIFRIFNSILFFVDWIFFHFLKFFYRILFIIVFRLISDNLSPIYSTIFPKGIGHGMWLLAWGGWMIFHYASPFCLSLIEILVYSSRRT